MLAKYEGNPALAGLGELSPRHGPERYGARRPSLLGSIWRRRRLVVVLTALALLPAILYIKLTTPLYTSSSKLLISRTAGNRVEGNGSDAATTQRQTADDSLTDAELSAQRSVITSTPVMAVALATPGVMECDPIRDHRDFIESLKRALNIETASPSLMTVSISSTSPDEANLIVGAVVQAYRQFLSSTRQNGKNEALSSLRDAKAAAQAELATKSAELLRFGEEHHVGGGDDNSGAGAAELESLAEAVNEAHVAAVGAKAANDELNRALRLDVQRAQALKWFEESSPASAQAETDDEELIRRELLALKTKQAELQQKFMPGHPSLVRLQQRIQDLNLEHDAAIQRRAAAVQQHEADVQRAYDDEQKRILDQAAQRSAYASRRAEVAQLQNRVNDIDRRIGNIAVEANANLPAVTELEPAKASLEPTSPDRRRILLIAAAAGFSLGCLLAIWLEIGSASSTPQPGVGLNLPVLAELPMLPTDFGPMGRGLRMFLDNGPELEEIFEGLDGVLDGAKMRGRGVIALITSPSRGDGKSTLASTLAIFIAQKHKRVLLVDADFRTPALARIFGIQDATGLSTLLEAEVSLPVTAIHHTGTPSLDVIPTGPLPRNSAELLNTQQFTDLLGDLAERYDYVLIDSPPSVTFTDARTISASADLTMMVLRADQMNHRMYQIASDGLTNVGANLCGVVLNSGRVGERPTDVFRGLDANNLEEVRPAELPPKRHLSNLVLAVARAVDLVRAPANEPPQRKQLFPNRPKASPRSDGELLSSSTSSDSLNDRT